MPGRTPSTLAVAARGDRSRERIRRPGSCTSPTWSRLPPTRAAPHRSSSRTTRPTRSGINDRVALADAERRMQRRIAEEHMRNGVTIVDPETTRIDAGVEIGQDARIEPWTVLAGSTVIGQDAVIGPHAHLRDTPHRPADDGLGQRARGVDRRRGRPRSVRTPTFGRGRRSGRAAGSGTSPRSRTAGSGPGRSSTTSATSATPRSART